MKISHLIYLYNILSASVAAGLDVKTVVGNGCKNEVKYSYAFYTDNGDSCDSCTLCTGTRIGFLFDPNHKNFCIKCDEAEGQCTTFQVATTFKSPWTMKFFSLISSDMVTDNTDPGSIMLNGSMDGTTWATLLSTDDSAGSLFKKRMVKQMYILDNNNKYSHYAVKYKLKKTSATMHLGASAILQVYVNECAAQIFSDVSGLNILPYTTLAPTSHPTLKPSPKPSSRPTNKPSPKPSPRPTNRPSPRPTNKPSPKPTNRPSPRPTNKPSPRPTHKPSPKPTHKPSPKPTNRPSPRPTNKPSPPPTHTKGITCACMNVKQNDYRGTTSKTRTGKTCQRWDRQYPHAHGAVQNYPSSGLNENYCRNPDRNPGGAWCYTTDSNSRWDYCDIPYCDIPMCNPTKAPTKRPTKPPGTCGGGRTGNGRCANGGCCSRFGWCGWDSAWCNDRAPITG